MSIPTATYRLQFRNGMTFDRAIDLIPHLVELNISHLYASPIFAATKGSTHGYDVIDPNQVDEALDGMTGLLRLSDALKKAGLGLILDIVPNHLAASLENPWWRDVIAWGRASRFADIFDIDWSQRLTLPVLAAPLDQELQAGTGFLVADAVAGTLAFDYRGSCYPLNPKTYPQVLDGIGAVPAAIIELADAVTPATAQAFHAAVGQLLGSIADLDAQLKSRPTPQQLTALLAQQSWRLMDWKDAANALSYRRFFEIAGLVGVRVEQPQIFDAMHRTVLQLVADGRVDGLRVDHIDGLADPEAYLVRLREAIGPQTYLVVEKILAHDEQLPADWPVEGTTGYEFITALADLFVDHRQAPPLDAAWRAINTDRGDAEAGLNRAKRQMVGSNFRGEVQALQQLARDIAATEADSLPADLIDTCVADLLMAFPVYRTYGSPRGLTDADDTLVDTIFASLLAAADPLVRQCLNALQAILRGHVTARYVEKALLFRTRMQHLTGPLLAKSLEDTFFYRYNRLIALNEVGGDPLSRSGSVALFHRKMQQRALMQPAALTATSTHDTKRGEDSRARLYALSEAPSAWIDAVDRWRSMHAHRVSPLPDGAAPAPETEWMIYQALAGAWPPDLDITDAAQLDALARRFLPYVEKALREAKQRTDWSAPAPLYEEAVLDYAKGLLSVDNAAFLGDFRTVLGPFIRVGLQSSLSQALLKMTVPGVPDLYQGCEGLDFSLVDPDNRRPPDFEALGGRAAGNADQPSDAQLYSGALKSRMTKAVLGLRKRHKTLFSQGQYVPLETEGAAREHIIAFARVTDEAVAIVAVPRLVFGAITTSTLQTQAFWQDTTIRLPSWLAGRHVRDAFDQTAFQVGTMRLQAATVFARRPFCLLLSVDAA